MNTALSKPLVSIIMPAYNPGIYIDEAIQSVLNQSYTHWELWVIDDASTDDTAERVKRFTDVRIHYHRVDKIGHPAGVRNTGLKLATGELVAFLDSDDTYLPSALETLTNALRKNPSWHAVYGFCQTMNQDGHPLPTWDVLHQKPNGTYSLPRYYSHSWRNLLLGNFNCLLAGLIIKRDIQQNVGLFNEDLYGPEDFEYFLRLHLYNPAGFAYIPQPIYWYRIHQNSLTKTPQNCQRILQSGLQIIDWLYTQADISDQIKPYRAQAYMGLYRYYARERLLADQPTLCRDLLAQAQQNPNITHIQWLWDGLGLWLRSYLPKGSNLWLMNLKKRLAIN